VAALMIHNNCCERKTWGGSGLDELTQGCLHRNVKPQLSEATPNNHMRTGFYIPGRISLDLPADPYKVVVFKLPGVLYGPQSTTNHVGDQTPYCEFGLQF